MFDDKIESLQRFWYVLLETKKALNCFELQYLTASFIKSLSNIVSRIESLFLLLFQLIKAAAVSAK